MNVHPEIKKIIKGFRVENVTYELKEKFCPECGGPLRNFVIKRGEQPKCGPWCMHETKDEFGRDAGTGCGYKGMKDRGQSIVDSAYKDSLKAKNMNIFLKGSLIGNRAMLEKTFDQFVTDCPETKQAKKQAMDFVDEVLQGEKAHLIYTGRAGTGKTHLAIALSRNFIEKTGYKKQALFISYAELYSQYKESINIPELVRAVINPVINELKTVDLLVLDDLGSELGKIDPKTTATNYNVELLQRIVEARTDKPTVFTTNLTGKQIISIYGDRIYSRIMANTVRKNGAFRVMNFKEITDNRLSETRREGKS